jgi:hypothetical protein
MKEPSALGTSIESAIGHDSRFQRHREPIQYLSCYRTISERVFALERVTRTQLTLWLPEDEKVRLAAEKLGLEVVKSVPRVPDPSKYGRLSSLQSVPELRDASLYRVTVTSAPQAISVLEALI